ncbi:MAG: YfcE family phosphodiesterase [Balneolales bacterium]
MKIAILSDTHDHVEHIKLFVEKIKSLQITTVLHAGDYCSPFTIPLFTGLNLIGVFGNNDGDHYRLVQKFRDINGEIYNEFHERKFGEKHIALYHGTQPAITEALVQCRKYDLVISGHTHTPIKEYHGKTLSLNPGALHGFGGDAIFAIYDTINGEADFMKI